MIDPKPTNPLDAVKRRAVRAVARENSPASEALFSLAAGQQKDWDRASWNDVLQSLDACDESVEAYRSIRE